MQVRNESRTSLAKEIKIVPIVAWVLAGIAFAAAQWFFDIKLAGETHPPALARAGMGLLAGFAAGIFIALIGYVNRDAKRRGMSPLLWTFVVILIPNALGFVLYFILRQSLQRACPQCGFCVQGGFSFCPRCGHKLSGSCPRCQRLVGAADVYCPYCGTSLQTPAAPAAKAPEAV